MRTFNHFTDASFDASSYFRRMGEAARRHVDQAIFDSLRRREQRGHTEIVTHIPADARPVDVIAIR